MKKIILGIVVLLVVAIGGGAYWFYSSLDSLVQQAIEMYTPDITQTRVKVSAVKLSLADGSGAINGLVVGNPKGFKTDHAVKAGAIELAVDPASLAKDVIVIRKIAVVAPDLNYETSDAGANFDVIQKNVQGYIERTIGKPDPAKKSGPGKKLIVEHLAIHDAKVNYAPALMGGKSITLPVPNIDLRNIGKAKGGVTSGELAAEITGALKSQVTSAVSNSVKGAAGAVGSAAKGVGDKVKGFFK